MRLKENTKKNRTTSIKVFIIVWVTCMLHTRPPLWKDATCTTTKASHRTRRRHHSSFLSNLSSNYLSDSITELTLTLNTSSQCCLFILFRLHTLATPHYFLSLFTSFKIMFACPCFVHFFVVVTENLWHKFSVITMKKRMKQGQANIILKEVKRERKKCVVVSVCKRNKLKTTNEQTNRQTKKNKRK